MGLCRWLRRRKPIDLETRSQRSGLKYKDIIVLGELLERGADPAASHCALYFLYFARRQDAENAAAEARRHGFEPALRPPLPAYSEHWCVICARDDLVLELGAVRAATDYFEDLARRHKGTYDGWDVTTS